MNWLTLLAPLLAKARGLLAQLPRWVWLALAGVVLVAGLELALAAHERELGRREAAEAEEAAWILAVHRRLVGLSNELAVAQAAAAIAHTGWRAVDTLRPPAIVVHDTTWVPLPVYRTLQLAGERRDSSCSVLALSCAKVHTADSAAIDTLNAKLKREIERTTPHRGWLGRLLEDGAAAAAGRLSCKL